jgi:hypothetical protein
MWWLWLFPVIGVGLLIGAGYAVYRTNQFRRTASEAIGEVVDYYEYDSSDDDGGTTHMYDPVIRFTPEGGGVVERRSGLGSSSRDYKLGQRIRLLYDPQDPEKFQINSPFRLYFAAGVLAFIGIVFTLVGVIVLLVFNSPHPELVDTPAASTPSDSGGG